MEGEFGWGQKDNNRRRGEVTLRCSISLGCLQQLSCVESALLRALGDLLIERRVQPRFPTENPEIVPAWLADHGPPVFRIETDDPVAPILTANMTGIGIEERNPPVLANQTPLPDEGSVLLLDDKRGIPIAIIRIPP